MLLLVFSIFLYYTVAEVIAKRRMDPLAEAAAGKVRSSSFWTAGRAAMLAALDLAVLLVGAQLTVSHAVSLAKTLGVPSAVIGLTVVAFGTSLPEFATSRVATWKG